MTDYPEHEKLKKVSAQSQVFGEFIDWLRDDLGLELCHYHGRSESYHPDSRTVNELLALFFDIDLEKIEQEKEQMLSEVRKANQEKA